MRVKHLSTFVLWIAVVLPGAVFADITTGVNWLATQPNADGSFGSTPTSLATPVQSTAEVLRAYQALGETAQPGFSPALTFLNSDTEANTEFLARKVIVDAQAGHIVTPLVNALLTHQNPDGGFGDRAGEQSTAFDTAYALEALAIANFISGTQVAAAVGYLMSRQQADGGWSIDPNTSAVFLTAQAMRALWHYRNSFVGVGAALTQAQNFLLSRRGANGSWNENFETASALIAVIPYATDLALVEASVAALSANQSLNGSWNDDSYTTALALRALRAYELRRAGTAAQTGSISGNIVKANSTEPIAGATVAINELSGISVTTNADGFFLIPGVPAGSFTVTATKTGFNAAGRAVTTQAGQVTLAGNLVLSVADTTGLVRGKVFDAADTLALAGVLVTLSGPDSFSATSKTDGQFDFGAVPSGTYTVTVSTAGYQIVTGSATVVGGETLVINQGLTKEGAFQDPDPVPVTGTVVDAKTGAPIVGAQFSLGTTLSGVSGANGQFTVASVPRGNYTATLSALGYVTQSYSLALPPGALGNLGTLALHAAADNTAPTSLTLNGLVVDGVTRVAIANASVTLLETGATAITGADGRFVLADIALKSFTLSLSATGYSTTNVGIQVAAFGETEVTLALAPPGTGAASSTLQGVVTDAATGAGIAGARVAIEGTNLSALTDAAGSYTLSGIETLEFVVTATAVGYAQASSPAQIAEHGNYVLNPALTPIAATAFHVQAVRANQPQWGANATALFTAEVVSLLDTPRSALVIGEIVDSAGNSVAAVTPFAEGTTTLASEFLFAANEIKTLTVPWSTAQVAPGRYRLVLRVVEPGTISGAAPLGAILAENIGFTSIVGSSAINGALSIDPPITQAGAVTPVHFSALVRNNGNVPLPASNYELSVTRAAPGAALHVVQIAAGPIEVGANVAVDFGSWVPTDSGDLTVVVRAEGGAVAGEITGVLHVGDKASGTFTVDKTVVPEGTQTVRSRISMQGVDARTGTSTDPLFPLVQQAVKRGGEFTGPAARSWHNTNRCLGCHIQTQSLFGFASSLDKAQVDRSTAIFLYNAIASSQQSTGALNISHPEFSRTQTELGIWALTAWPDKQESFRTIYKAADYLFQRRALSGATTFWTVDHSSSGWWVPNVSATTLALAGITDALRSAQALDMSQVKDYSLGPGISLGAGINPLDIESGPDGALYTAKHNARTVVRLDPSTGATTTVASGFPNNVYGIAFADDGTMYVSGIGFLSRVNANGTQQVVISTGGSHATDVERGPDGLLYVADHHSNRILRFNPATQATEVWISGGLLTNPYGLAFDAAGNLLVASHNGFKILRIAPDKTATVFADALAFRPVWLDVAADGHVYVSSSSVDGLYRIDPEGIAERLFSVGILRGVIVRNGKVFVGNQATNTMHEVIVSPFSTPALTTWRNELPRVANFFLGNFRDNSSDNAVHAMRMIGLDYLRDTIADPALISQLDAAIAFEDNLLRTRQRADGGWGRSINQASDPLITAMVGIAIDVTDPSPDDPQVRKTIQYLLNTQATTGLWNNVNNGLTTQLASTSFVMAYLPKAIERLGGIDVDLHLDVAPDVLLANPSISPTTVTPSTDGGTRYLWSLLGVTSSGRNVEFDLTLQNLQLHESRPVARNAFLEFENSFTQERLQVPLEIPVVRVASELTLTVATDKVNYQVPEPVLISGAVANTGPTTASGEIRLAIRAPGEPVHLAELDPIPVTDLASGASQPYSATWDTGTTFAGTYEVYARLFDTAGRLLVESTAPFNIGALAVVAATRVTTDKPVYDAWDSVQIDGRVQNVALNAFLAPTRVEITVQTPNGSPLYFDTRNVNALAAGGLVDVPFSLSLVDAVSGAYPVTLVLKDDFTRSVLSTSTTSFAVERRAVQAIVGTVTVNAPRVSVGDSNVCTETAKNISSTALSNVKLVHQLISVDQQTVINEFIEFVDLPPGGLVHSYFRNVDTTGFALGGYACAITAEVAGGVQTLAFGGFQVIEPPIKISATLATGSQGRLLVLLDPAASCGVNCLDDTDPHGPTTAPGLTNQRLFLEGLLTQTVWSYTIVESAEAFTQELRSGHYTLYALFNEQEKLSEQAQKELREAVFRGEGLLVAGAHDHRELHANKLIDALGVDITGTDPVAAEVDLTQSPLNLTGRLRLLAGDKALRVQPQSAQSAGRYVVFSNGNHTPDAVTLNSYGRGKAAFMSFDVLAIATRDGEASLTAALLLEALGWATPVQTANLTGTAKAIALSLTNQGIATETTVTVTLPAGAAVLDPDDGVRTDNTLVFTRTLAVDQTTTLTFWVKLPDTAGSVTFEASISAGTPATVLATPTLTLEVTQRELSTIAATLDALVLAAHPNTKELNQARLTLQRALTATTPDLALSELLKATDALLGLTDPAIVELRTAMGEWVRVVGQRVF